MRCADHMESGTRSVEDGKNPGVMCDEDYEEKVVTYSASMTGELVSDDKTGVFQPKLSKTKVVLMSKFERPTFSWDFNQSYQTRMHMFFNANRRDTFQEKTETFQLPPMKEKQVVSWVDLPTPWWMNETVRLISSLTCSATCWLSAVDSYIGTQEFTFKKQVHAFKDAEPSGDLSGA